MKEFDLFVPLYYNFVPLYYNDGSPIEPARFQEIQMVSHQFTFVLRGQAIADEDCDALYEAGCDDGTIVTRNGVTHIAFDREAASLDEAIRSATADVRRPGFEVARVEMDALV